MIINTTGTGGGGGVDYLSVVDGKVCITYDDSLVSSNYKSNTSKQSNNEPKSVSIIK